MWCLSDTDHFGKETFHCWILILVYSHTDFYFIFKANQVCLTSHLTDWQVSQCFGEIILHHQDRSSAADIPVADSRSHHTLMLPVWLFMFSSGKIHHKKKSSTLQVLCSCSLRTDQMVSENSRTHWRMHMPVTMAPKGLINIVYCVHKLFTNSWYIYCFFF